MKQNKALEAFQSALQQLVMEQVQVMVKEALDSIKTKEFYTLEEVHQNTGITPRALKERNKRGTIQLNRFGSNTLLMSAEEYQKLIKKIKASK